MITTATSHKKLAPAVWSTLATILIFGASLFVMLVSAWALDINNKINHLQNSRETQRVELEQRLTRIESKVDLLIENHKITMTGQPTR